MKNPATLIYLPATALLARLLFTPTHVLGLSFIFALSAICFFRYLDNQKDERFSSLQDEIKSIRERLNHIGMAGGLRK
jgi:hypothetical protein